MELRHLRHFVAVAEELHFARAAERLGMEQSPLSHSIRNLEAELKVKLFQRTTRQTWLTRAGAHFYDEVKRILGDIDAATASLHEQGVDQPTRIRLVLGEDLAAEAFTRFLFELEHHRPAFSVHVRELSHSQAARLVRNGGADVVLTLNSQIENGLHQIRAWAEPLVLVVPIGHPFAERDSVSLREIAGERFALPRSDVCPGYLGQIDDIFARHQLTIANRVTVRHWNTAVSFAATGRAMALCPASNVAGTTGAVVVTVEEELELVTWLLYRDGEPSTAVSWVLEVAVSVAAGSRSS